jgi:hypothetical protein
MADERLRSERSVGLFAVGFLALNFPILSLFEQQTVLFGVPALYLYLFVLWTVLISLSFASLRQRKTDARGAQDT